MKRLYILFACSFCAVAPFAQEASAKLKKADMSYKKFSYNSAIDKYESIGVLTINEKRKLANSYWKTNNLQKAETIYQEIVKLDDATSDDVYAYASVLRENKKYNESDEWMKEFASMNQSDSRGQAYAAKQGAYEQLQKNKGQFDLKNLSINTEQQDFGATYYKDRVVFASSREGFRSIYRRWNWNQLPYLDVYVAGVEDGELSSVERFGKKVNKKFHEGPVAFNQAGDLMIFTRNNYKEKANDGIVRLKLFSSKLVDGEWSEPKPLPYNSADYSCGHASISGDGKWIYFASDMPGGKGGVDIYKASIDRDGNFGEAINLGESVNTEGNEMFPYVMPDDEMLFFSSNGHVGLGGLDVFVAQLKDEGAIGKVMNVGAPVNSNRDDFAFVLKENQKEGYLSSNREGGKGDDDIYAVVMNNPFTFGKIVKGVAYDKKGQVLATTEVVLVDEETGQEQVVITGDDGAYSFNVEEGKAFKLKGTKEKYFDGFNTANTGIEEEVIVVDLELEKDPGLALYALVTDKKSGEPLEGVTMTVVDNMTGESQKITTPASGDYLRPLADKKLNDRGSYNFVLERDGYLSKTVTYNTEFDREGKYEVHTALDMSLEPIEVGGDLSKIIDINPIYFDLGKSKIRPDAATELDKIVKVMNENPNMVIELGSHTDSRGSNSSNESLSDRRAKASAAYIAKRISNPERIYGKGYGESVPNKLVLDDGTEQILTEDFINSFKSSDRKKFDAYHQKNRRTEFIIIKM